MFKNAKWFICGVIITLIMMCIVSVSSEDIFKEISVIFNNIKIVLNGEELHTTDVNGKEVEPFIYEGTTYVPIRAVSEAFGKDVYWSDEEQKVTITDPITIAEDGSNLFPFREGDLYGYMDINGKIRIEPQFYIAGYFYEGLAVVQKYDFEKKIITSGAIDVYGNYVIPLDAIEIDRFSEGMAIVHDIGYMSKEDLEANQLSDHDWIIETNEPSQGDYYIDKNGNKISDNTFGTAYNFTGDFALVDKSKSSLFNCFSYVDKTGNLITDEEFNKAHMFFGGHTIVARNGSFVLINTDLETLFSLDEYEGFFMTEDGYVRVEKDGKYGFINDKNEVIIPLEYDGLGNYVPIVSGFKEGLCPAKKDGKWGYIDINNNVVIPFQYEDGMDFHNGLANVTLSDGKEGLINKKGELVFETDKEIWMVSENGMYAIGESTPRKVPKRKIVRVTYQDGNWDFVDVCSKPITNTKIEAYLNKNLEIVVPHY